MKNNQLPIKDQAILHTIKQYIIVHVDKDLSIAQLTKESGFNQDKLKWGFKALFGITIHHYIMEQRMYRAKDYLLQTDRPLKDIASLIGYSQRNFYATFKHYFSVTPAVYRHQHPGGKQPTLF